MEKWRDVVKADLKMAGVLYIYVSQHFIKKLFGMSFMLMRYRVVDTWSGMHCQQYSVVYVAGHFGGSRIEQGISALRSDQSQCTNNKVCCSTLPVGNGSGVGEVLQCTTVSCWPQGIQ